MPSAMNLGRDSGIARRWGRERRIRANAPAAGRPRTANPTGGHGGFRLGPGRDIRRWDGGGLDVSVPPRRLSRVVHNPGYS